MSDIGAQWFRDGLRFSCQPGCVRCCCGAPGDVLVTDDEVLRIAAFLSLPVSQFEAVYLRHYASGRKSLVERANGDCILLDGRGCSVYAIRPKQCRDYPFWPEIIASPVRWLRESSRCPGINTGPVNTIEDVCAVLVSQEKEH